MESQFLSLASQIRPIAQDCPKIDSKIVSGQSLKAKRTQVMGSEDLSATMVVPVALMVNL